MDDAKNTDLIFIGSPSENLTLLEIPSTREFLFRRVAEGPRAGNMEIVNVHPGQGEPTVYIATAANVPITGDYAVVALEQGINPEHSELVLAGTTTIGTQAVVEFVTRENYLNGLLQRMKVSGPSDVRPFEAAIQGEGGARSACRILVGSVAPPGKIGRLNYTTLGQIQICGGTSLGSREAAFWNSCEASSFFPCCNKANPSS